MNYKTVLLLSAAVVYLFLFFQTPFEPYSALGNDTPPRLSFFSYLLLPDVYFSSWLGTNEEFSITDRLPIAAYVFITLLCIWFTGIGLLTFLTDITFHYSNPSPNGTENEHLLILFSPEYVLFSFVFGCGVITNFLFYADTKLAHLFSERLPILVAGVIPIICLILLLQNPFHFLFLGKKLFSLCSSAFAALTVLAVIYLFLAAAVPSTDYDVLSYHLAGAKEFTEQGQLTFLPHNVYANMPFGAEMFYVWGIALTGKVFAGALVGKILIALTTLITALGLYCFCKRFCNEPYNKIAGLTACILYLTNPWVFCTSTAGLIDSTAGMYSFFALYAALLAADRFSINTVILCGFFAGCAAACKYPAVIYTVLSLFLFVTMTGYRQKHGLQTAAHFLFFCLLACAGWYFKNWYFTGNPVYPLCWNIFGDSTGTWNSAVNVRWTAVHSPHGFGLFTLLHDIYRIFLSSAWNAPLIVPLLLFALPVKFRSEFYRLLLWLLFFFAVWWGCTHRLERFFVPAIPVLTVLAGYGAANFAEKFGRKTLYVLLGISTVYCFIVCGSPAPGKLNRFFAPIETLRKDPNVSTPWAVYFNSHPPDGKILLIGEAKAFLYQVPVLYSVCWNETLLKTVLIKDGVENANPADEFYKWDIEYILVDWNEINRFRSPGNYGFTDFVQQAVFDKLLADGVLEQIPPPNEDCAKTNVAVYWLKITQ